MTIIIAGETAWTLETLTATPEDWVFKIIAQLEKDGTATPEIYTEKGYHMLEELAEKVIENMVHVVNKIKTYLDKNGLGEQCQCLSNVKVPGSVN